jgi:hypothetical protein
LRLKINFHKSGFFSFGEASEEAALYAELFGCEQSQFPISYLGILIHYQSLLMSNGNTWRRDSLNSWKEKLLSLGERLALNNSLPSNMVLYMISVFSLPKRVLHRLDYIRSRFSW